MNCHSRKFVSRFACVLAISAGVGLIFLTACRNNSQTYSDQQVQQRAAQVAQSAKQRSKEALEKARGAAANAEGKINAVAAGVRQGIKGNVPAAGARIDLNTASEDDLAALPGMSQKKARQIVSHRPYSSTHQLVERGVLSQSQLEELSSSITVH